MSFDAGSIKGGIDWDISSFTKGMFQVEAVSRLFPGFVSSFLANPLLGLVDVAKEAFEGIGKAFEMGIDAAKEYAATIQEVAFSNAEAAESAKALGLSVEVFTGLAGAAKLAGSDVMSLSEGLKFLNRNIADAAYGNQDLRKEFMELGISVVDSTGHLRDTKDVFFETADAISRLPDAALRTRFALDLMGRSAEGMLPFLAHGAKGIKEYMAVTDRLGATTSTVSAEAGEKYRLISYEWDLMWKGIKQKASDAPIKFVAANFDQLQGELFSLSDMAGKAIDNAFQWIEAHHTDIENDFTLIKAKAMEAFNWIEGDHPKIAAAFKEMMGDATKIASAIHGIGDAWVWSRNMLEEYTKKLGDVAVKAANDASNAGLKPAGGAATVTPPTDPHAWTFGNVGRDLLGGAGWLGKEAGSFGMTGAALRWLTPRLTSGLLADLSFIPGLGKLRPAADYMMQQAPSFGGYRGGDVNVNAPITVDPQKTANAIAQAIKPELQKVVTRASNAAILQARQAAQRKGL